MELACMRWIRRPPPNIKHEWNTLEDICAHISLQNTCWIILDTLHPCLLVLHVYSHSHLGSAPCSSDFSVSIHRRQMCPDRSSPTNAYYSPGSQSCWAETADLLLKFISKWQFIMVFGAPACLSLREPSDTGDAGWVVCVCACVIGERMCEHLLSWPRVRVLRHRSLFGVAAAVLAESTLISISTISQVSSWAVTQHRHTDRHS